MMNKRLEKLMVKLSEKRVVTPRRDQVKKMVEENAFDTMIYRGYDEVYNVEPVETTEFTAEDIAKHWWTGADMWGTMEQKDGKEWIEVTLKFGYAYIELRKYINVVEEVATTETNTTVSPEEITIELNEEKNGIEVKFNNKPSNEIIEGLKSNGFRWSKYNKCWYAKQSENTIKFAYSLIMEDVQENEINLDATSEYAELLECEVIEAAPEVEEIQLNKNTVEFVNVESLNINIQARMPKSNKNDSLYWNDKSIEDHGFDLEPCRVRRIVFLTNEQYDYFSNNLLNDYDFLDKGGHNSMTNYVNAIVSTGRKILIVNPEGHTYCRYTGYINEDYNNSLHNTIDELDPFTESEESKQLTKALEEFYYMLTGETAPIEEQPEENSNVISLDIYRNKKTSKQEIKQPNKNNKIVLCGCGCIIHEDDYKEIGICPNCINYVLEKFDNGTLKSENPELYNMIAEGLKTN